VVQAFQDVSVNPQNYANYENSPKIKSVINKMAAQFGGGMGMGGMGGGFPAAEQMMMTTLFPIWKSQIIWIE
jgi:hypothetical protein